jgi:hypothetical protein
MHAEAFSAPVPTRPCTGTGSTGTCAQTTRSDRGRIRKFHEFGEAGVLDQERLTVWSAEEICGIGLSVKLFDGVSEKMVAAWRSRAMNAMKMYPSDFAAAPQPIRLTLLVALCHTRQVEITDGLVESG